MKKQKPGRVRCGNPARNKAKAPPRPAQPGPRSRPPAGRTGIFDRQQTGFRFSDIAARAGLIDRSRGRARKGSYSLAAVASDYTREDRRSLLILLAPFFILAFSLACQQVMRTMPGPHLPGIARPAGTHEAPSPVMAPVTAEVRPTFVPPAPKFVPPATVPRARPQLSVPIAQEAHPEIVHEARPVKTAVLPPLPRLSMPALPPIVFSMPAAPAAAPHQPIALEPSIAGPMQPPAAVEQKTASLDPVLRPEMPRPALPVPSVPSSSPAPVPLTAPAPPPACAMPAALLGGAAAAPPSAPVAPAAFGRALAEAAGRQLGDLVIYNARYSRIAYPMGDVAGLYGVCTDVVVRAYRALGIDLQELIAKTGSGRGDRNIDHRRVDVVRRFFERFGQSLAISEFAENYQPGDIVTYYRPQNRTSTSHIAVVSEQLAPSGRLMIVHNRGWGPQLEDALFVDKITGHYRFQGIGVTPASASPGKGPARSDAIADRVFNRTPWHVDGVLRHPATRTVPATLIVAGTGRTERAICMPEPAGDPAEPIRETAGETPRAGVRNLRKSRVSAMRTASAITPNR